MNETKKEKVVVVNSDTAEGCKWRRTKICGLEKQMGKYWFSRAHIMVNHASSRAQMVNAIRPL